MNAENRTLLLIVVLLAACGGSPVEEPAEAEVPSELQSVSSCHATARARLSAWQAAGLPAAEIDRRYRLAVSSCAGKDIDSATAVFVGAINVDYERLARLMISKNLTPNEYLSRVKDRSKKSRLGRNDPTWTADYVRGDADGDLVPNVRDACPDTRDLAPTNDRGCAPATEPAGRVLDANLVHRVIDKIGIMRSAACDGAVLPTVPEPIDLRYSGPNYDFQIEISKVNNQPADCMVFYEIIAEQGFAVPLFDQYGNITQWLPANGYQRIAFKDLEAVATTSNRITFQIVEGATGHKKKFRENTFSLGSRWRVRAINGNGLASAWSGEKHARP